MKRTTMAGLRTSLSTTSGGTTGGTKAYKKQQRGIHKKSIEKATSKASSHDQSNGSNPGRLLAQAILEHNTKNGDSCETTVDITNFQRAVYDTLCQVPAGKVTTYHALAQAIHCGSSQAVGQALKKNPYAPSVPCHRVVQSNFSLGGFGGQTSGTKIDKKRGILEKEGVGFDQNGKVDPTCLFTSFAPPPGENHK